MIVFTVRYILDEVLAVSAEDCSLSKEMQEMISDEVQTYHIHKQISNLLDNLRILTLIHVLKPGT